MAFNSDESVLAVKNSDGIIFFSAKERKVIQQLYLPKQNSGGGLGTSFMGIVWEAGDRKIWITDAHGYLRSAEKDGDGLFKWKDEIFVSGFDKKSSYLTGFHLDEKNGMIYVASNRNNTLMIVNLKTSKIEAQIPVGVAPYAVLVKGHKAYVSNWGGRHPKGSDLSALSSGSLVAINKKNGVAASGTVSVVDLANRREVKEIEVGLHPGPMVFSKDQSLLYVANANSDSISEIDTRGDKLVRSFSVKPMKGLPFGSAPDALAISPDGKTLYSANAGDNLIAVINLLNHQVIGLIPTGWYPGSVAISRRGQSMVVGNMKGVGIQKFDQKEKGYNVLDQLGSVSFIDLSKDSLEDYTVRAGKNLRLPKINEAFNLSKVKEKWVPVPTQPGEKSFIKHVIYIIKENRTYDQVFGDLPQGNGDSSLCMYGRNITPNQHKLAEEFVLLDNTYCNGLKSAEGHNWASQGYVTDYLEKMYPSFVRSYPWNGGDAINYSPSGFIWDYVLAAGLRFRTYGEFVFDEIVPANSTWTDIYKDYLSGAHKIKIIATPTVHTLKNHYCPSYTGGPREINDQYKADVFIKELRQFEKTDSFPHLMMVSLPNNHTSGTQPGFPTPEAMVADNDLALGRIVEAVSNSKFWKETAILVIEDDPQFGFDHVNGHRTISLCISPYTKRNAVVSTNYNQNSLLRTIQLILGLPPMTYFDLLANPMTDCFTSNPNFAPYKSVPNNIPLDRMNPPLSALKGKQLYWAKKSLELNLKENDDLSEKDEITLNKILWHHAKGYQTPYPHSDEYGRMLIK